MIPRTFPSSLCLSFTFSTHLAVMSSGRSSCLQLTKRICKFRLEISNSVEENVSHLKKERTERQPPKDAIVFSLVGASLAKFTANSIKYNCLLDIDILSRGLVSRIVWDFVGIWWKTYCLIGWLIIEIIKAAIIPHLPILVVCFLDNLELLSKDKLSWY